MSTELHSIKGRVEIKNSSKTFQSNYKDSELYITRFYGGNKNGRMLQLTTSEDCYIQLTQKQVKELIEVLQNAFDYEIYPSE